MFLVIAAMTEVFHDDDEEDDDEKPSCHSKEAGRRLWQAVESISSQLLVKIKSGHVERSEAITFYHRLIYLNGRVAHPIRSIVDTPFSATEGNSLVRDLEDKISQLVIHHQPELTWRDTYLESVNIQLYRLIEALTAMLK